MLLVHSYGSWPQATPLATGWTFAWNTLDQQCSMNANYHEYTAQKALCCVMSTPGVAAICLPILFFIHSEAKLAHCSFLSQHAQHAISILLFSKVQWKQQATVLLYCNVLYCILFPSVRDKFMFRIAVMTLSV